ncbi:MAG: alpha/beta fold hydrolase [Deltaproteobacteria bacterium]|nr:alpha/beta fold hydrolase [Deltaproteobacteria bacterium]
MTFVLLAALGLLLALLLRSFAGRRFRLETNADAIFFATTSDGARLAVHRYLPSAPRAGELPVVLCHGLGANRFNLDFDERYSFARYLRGRGYDVFVMELRGAGLSHGGGPRSHTFDDHVERDMPAVLDLVRSLTGAEKVNWVGHSLGGIIAYAALATALKDRLHAIATLGSPATFAHQRFLRVMAFFHPLVRPFVGVATALPARLFAPFFVRPLAPVFSLLANGRNLDASVARRALWNLVSDVSPGVIAQFVGWIKKRSAPHISAQREPDSHWAHVDQPMLFIAGQADWALAPPAAVRHAFYKSASAQKEIIVLAKKNGFSADYGHGDLVLGENAPQEVFPLIERFLWQHRRLEVASETRRVA